MLEGVKIECWDKEDSHGSIELDLDAEEGDEPILHICMPTLDALVVTSIWLNDLKRAIRQLETK